MIELTLMTNSTHRVEVFRVGQIDKHPNADKLEVMHVFDAYQAIVRKGDYKVGDLACYIPPDNILPDKPEYAFLKGHFRIRVTKLRGIVSQGLVLPAPIGSNVGDDVSAQLGVTHYVPQFNSRSHGAGGGGNQGEMVADPPVTGPNYDIDSWFRYASLMEQDEMNVGLVELTEKLHGCVAANTSILMADGSTETISALVNQQRLGEEVLGVDSNGNIVPTKILNLFNNGTTEDWMNVQGTRHGCGRGSSYLSLYVTPNHEFFCPTNKTYLSADKLSPGTEVLLYRSEYILSPVQRSILLGKMLGDGSLSYNEHSASLEFGHKTEHQAYVEWTMQGLSTLGAPGRDYQTSGFGTPMVRARTIQRAEVFDYLKDFVDGDKKRVPSWIVDEITPLSLAFWYMDDGSLAHHENQEDRACFAVCNFSKGDCDVLIQALKKFNIEAIYYETGSYPRLRINAESAEMLFLLIAPYIPPIMQYKLPLRYRGHNGWLPSSTTEFRPVLTKQTIVSTKQVTHPKGTGSSIKYDLETGTHNFFANGVLVHNSNTRASYQEGKFWMGSRNHFRRHDKNTLYWRVFYANPWLKRLCRNNPGYVIYGETYGNIQDLKYGMPQSEDFRVFDIWTGTRFLDWFEKTLQMEKAMKPTFWEKVRFFVCNYFNANTKIIGIPIDDWHDHYVPILYIGMYSREIIEQYMNGNSTIPGAIHMREGVVIKPFRELWHPHIGRLVLKAVSPDYLGRD